MPTDTPTAQQLWDQTDNFERRGGPGRPNSIVLDRKNGIWKRVSTSCCAAFPYPNEDAAAILRDHGHNWLIGEGYHRFEWEHDSDTDLITLGCYDIEVKSKTILGCYNAAIGAVLDAKEGK